MDDCHLTRSPSISSFGTNHSSWSFVGEDDFDLLDQDRDGSISENEMNELDSNDDDDDDNDDDDDEQIEDDDDENDEESDGSIDDDDISVLTEDENVPDDNISTLVYSDVNRVSEQLDQLSKCFDSPFNHILENFILKWNIRFTAVISAAIIVIIVFYSLLGNGKPESLLFTSTESVCFVGKEHILGLQYRDAAPSFLQPFFETLLKPSISTWSILPSNIPKLHANEPFSWIFDSENIKTIQDERKYVAKNQCEYVSIEHHFNAMSEAVRRYLRHKKNLEKPCTYESPTLPNINQTLIDGKSTEPNRGKVQTDLQKPLALPKPTLPILPLSANRLTTKPKNELLTSILSPDSVLNAPLRKEIISVSKSVADLKHIENHCFEIVPAMKKMKSLEKKKTKSPYEDDLSSLFTDSKFFESGDSTENDFKKKVRQSKKGKNEVLAIYSIKKAISKTIERTKIHRDKLFEQSKKSVENTAGKNRPKVFRIGEKTNIGKERRVLNSSCNVLASLARTLASISLFPAIVGQTNAAKYISSLLDLSTCTGLRLVCEKCWWTRECCPKERCTFLPWQRHFNTKRFLTAQGHKMLQLFGKLGWSMPEKKRKNSDDKSKFKFDNPSRSANSKKEMRSWQHKKKSVERYSKKNGAQDRIH